MVLVFSFFLVSGVFSGVSGAGWFSSWFGVDSGTTPTSSSADRGSPPKTSSAPNAMASSVSLGDRLALRTKEISRYRNSIGLLSGLSRSFDPMGDLYGLLEEGESGEGQQPQDPGRRDNSRRIQVGAHPHLAAEDAVHIQEVRRALFDGSDRFGGIQVLPLKRTQSTRVEGIPSWLMLGVGWYLFGRNFREIISLGMKFSCSVFLSGGRCVRTDL